MSQGAKEIIDLVPQGLEDSWQLMSWWQSHRKDDRLHKIPAVREQQFGNENHMFLGEVPLKRGLLPVIGLEQESFYDRPRLPASQQRTSASWYRMQIQEFALRYFMRTALSRQFKKSIENSRPAQPRPLENGAFQGWGYYQLYFKDAQTGIVKEFLPEDRFKLIDLREIGPVYKWVVFKVRFFDFIFRRPLLEAGGPQLEVPVTLDTYVVIDSRFVSNQENPAPGIIGEYGFGTPVIPVPDPESILSYGPGQLTTAFQFIQFRVHEDGEIKARTLLVANRPTRLLNFHPLDLSLGLIENLTLGWASPLLRPFKRKLAKANLPPIPLLFTITDVANTLTGGLASFQFCIAREQLYREVMATHFVSLEGLILRSLSVWNSVGDWSDESKLPMWIRRGL